MRSTFRVMPGAQVGSLVGPKPLHVPGRKRPAISQVGSTVVASVSGTTNNVTSSAYPTPAVGDLIVVVAYQRSGATGANLVVTSSGLTFTQIAYSGDSTDGIGAWYAWSPDTTARTVSVTYTQTGNVGSGLGEHIYVFRGVDPAVPIDSTGVTESHGSASTYTLSEITTYTPSAALMYGVGTLDDNSIRFDNTPLRYVTHVTNISTVACLASGWGEQPIPGSSGTGSCALPTNSPDAGRSVRFALRAA